MANKKGAGHYDRYVGTCRFLNEVNQARHSQLAAAAVFPAKLTPEMEVEVASIWWWQSYHTAADEYYEGLQRTHQSYGRKLDGHDSCCCVAGTFQKL